MPMDNIFIVNAHSSKKSDEEAKSARRNLTIGSTGTVEKICTLQIDAE